MSVFETIYVQAADDPLATDDDPLVEETDFPAESVKAENGLRPGKEVEAAKTGTKENSVQSVEAETSEVRIKTEPAEMELEGESWSSEFVSCSLGPSVIIKKEEDIDDDMTESHSPGSFENHQETEQNGQSLITALTQANADGYFGQEYNPGRLVLSSHLEALMKNKTKDNQSRTVRPSGEMPRLQPAPEELACSSQALKRRRSDPSMWVRNQKKRDRNFGKDKTFSDVDCGCKTLWHGKLSEEERENNFNFFWAMGDHGRQNVFICERVVKKEVKRPRSRRGVRPRKSWSLEFYVLNKFAESVRVCKQYFCDTYQISAGRLMRALQKERLGRAGEDLRGKTKAFKTSHPMANVVRSHILLFPSYSSPRTRSRDAERRYLPSHLNIRKMFSLYTEHYENTENKSITEVFYRKIFKELNLSFCAQRETCRTCDKLKALIEAANNKDDVNALKSEGESHLAAMVSDSNDSHTLKEDGESRLLAMVDSSNDSHTSKGEGESHLAATSSSSNDSHTLKENGESRLSAMVAGSNDSHTSKGEGESHLAATSSGSNDSHTLEGKNKTAKLSVEAAQLAVSNSDSLRKSARTRNAKARKKDAELAANSSPLRAEHESHVKIEVKDTPKPALSPDGLKAELNRHLEEVEKAKNCMKEDIELATTNLRYHVASFALQKALPFPSVTASAAYSKRRMYCHNFGVHDLAHNSVWMYLWDETTAARGPQEIAACLAFHLKTLVKKTHVVCYTDYVSGSRNLDMALTLMKIMMDDSNSFSVLDLKFLMCGHFCTKNDTDFASVESVAKHKVIYDFDDWLDTIRTARVKHKPKVHAMAQEDFVSTEKLKENAMIVDEVNWSKIQWIRFCKETPLIMFYKEVLDDSPFRELHILPTVQIESLASMKQQRLFHGQRPVAVAKKNDMLDLLAYIPPVKHSFFLNLEAREDVEDVGPLSDVEDDIDED